MTKIKSIWFDGEWLYGLGDDGNTYRQSLLWYPRLRAAGEDERERYEFSTIGIHWRELDEDVSFESFLYDDAEPTRLQTIFLTHPEINVSGFARKYGFNASLLRNYINGFKKPSPEMESKILSYVRQMGVELSSSS
ncbi:MAG: DUF2442 domain-containing protein [Bacteroidales bacterium]|nr:DUF2442 domain-containing protein [Bacteroidales bacterium]